ncbi:hypothetical protein KKH46_00220 [Patescibacteria group bacterium]|nr:hypothetical protein [Patescibacteria group bacterium]MBU1956049.1 hypothetical protein [Patescibacteria group bacterium]
MEKLNEKNKPIFVVTTKRLIIGIVVLVLVLLFAFWGGDGENKNSSVNIPNVAPNNNSANMNLPSDDSNPNVGNTTDTNNEAVGAGQSTEEVKEEPVTEPKPAQAETAIDVVGLVGEYEENEIQSRGGFYGGFGKITKFVETKTLEISIGNYDKNGKFIEEKRFISNKITSGAGGGCTTKYHEHDIKGKYYYGCYYNGYFLFPDGSVTGTESTPVAFYVKIEDNLFVLEGGGAPYINENNLWMQWMHIRLDISKDFTD